LVAVTVANYLPFVRSFLTERFGDGPLLLKTLRSSDLEEFVVRHAASMCGKRAQLMVTALRSVLRFLLQQGNIEIDLAASVISDTSNFRPATIRIFVPHPMVRLSKSLNDRSLDGHRQTGEAIEEADAYGRDTVAGGGKVGDE
jgi:hypothetical protein